MKKRIALISTHGYVAAEPPLGAPDTGGQVVFVLELAQKLGLFGYEVDVWTRQFEDQVEIEEISPNVRLLRVPCGNDQFIAKEYLYLNIAEWFENARRYIKKNQLSYDFINSHYWDAGIAGNLLAKELDVPHIHTPHSIGSWKREQMLADFPDSSETFEEQYNFNARIYNERIVYNSCELVIATTHIQKDKLELDYEIPEDKIKVIPPGYDDNRFFPVGGATREITRQRLGFHSTTILTISRLAKNKGLDLLIDGFKILADKDPDAKLVLAVGHDERNPQEQRIFDELLEKREQYNLQDRIAFGGYIEDDDLADYYRAADVFVMPSRYEPFGMTAVEAMACGTPTVTTIHGGLYRLLEYGIHSLFADPLDKYDLGITLSKSLRYPALRRRLSQSGAQFARARFTWTGIAQQLLNAVESVEFLSN
ncbi:glycosyltransferase [bacterium]|nr:glycosyltransferase [bacterium]